MKTLLSLIMITICFEANPFVTMGYLHGKHFPDTGLNNSHPFVEIADTVLVYKNSFGRTAVAIYDTVGDELFKLKIGITSGYKRTEIYNNHTYYQPLTVTKDASIMLAPVLEFNKQQTRFIFAILGNSVNIGVGFNF